MAVNELSGPRRRVCTYTGAFLPAVPNVLLAMGKNGDVMAFETFASWRSDTVRTMLDVSA